MEKRYGALLAESIRANGDMHDLSEYERFVLDSGYKYETEESLKNAYDRAWKARHNLILTFKEFLEEADPDDEDTAIESYDQLVLLVHNEHIKAGAIYQYARYRWCLRHPEAIVAHETGNGSWTVNNCETEITTEMAKILVCEEWGFEASRVKIVETPYYESTDWQFIRFDCAHMTWLWANSNLYQVYH